MAKKLTNAQINKIACTCIASIGFNTDAFAFDDTKLSEDEVEVITARIRETCRQLSFDGKIYSQVKDIVNEAIK